MRVDNEEAAYQFISDTIIIYKYATVYTSLNSIKEL